MWLFAVMLDDRQVSPGHNGRKQMPGLLVPAKALSPEPYNHTFFSQNNLDFPGHVDREPAVANPNSHLQNLICPADVLVSVACPRPDVFASHHQRNTLRSAEAPRPQSLCPHPQAYPKLRPKMALTPKISAESLYPKSQSPLHPKLRVS